MKILKISLPHEKRNPCPILIGEGLWEEILSDLVYTIKAHRYVLITDSRLKNLYGEDMKEFFRDHGLTVDLLYFPEGEMWKNLNTISELAKSLLELGIDRKGCLIALGGGVVGDVVGFLASIYMRAISYVQVPTTLLAQVDSSIGGKTGVDLPGGKNILGTFHQPLAIYIDVSFLRSLHQRQIRNGLAEVIKYGCIKDKCLLRTMEEEGRALLEPKSDAIQRIVERAVEIKAEIVKEDERERGLRRILNFGHTLGHAVESASGFNLLHGEAVSIGIVGATRISKCLGMLDEKEEEEILKALVSTGLPVKIPELCSTEEIFRFLNADKKRRKGANVWVLLEGIGRPVIKDNITRELIERIIEEMRDG